MNVSNCERVPPLDPYRAHIEALEISDKMVEKFMAQDNHFPTLVEKMRLTSISGATLSGLHENDFPTSLALPSMACVNFMKLLNKVPMPPEILEQCGNLNGDFTLGLFPEISRAWLTVDSDIYIWNFETGGDVAYYDGLSDVILSVGLVKPKKGVFQSFIRYLLILTTTVEIVILGVTLSQTADKKSGEELQLTPETIYALTTDGIPITTICGTDKGRIFLGGRDGSLFEIVYQKEIGWWGKRSKKVNHSRNSLSFLLPSFLNITFYEDDPIVQIVVDDSRNTLFTLTEKSTIEVFDLGNDGMGMSRVASVSYSSLLNKVQNVVSTLDIREVSKVVSLCPLDKSDSLELSVVGVTMTGVRLYLTTGSLPPQRPHTLHLLHVRLPPGYAANSVTSRPGCVIDSVHKSGAFIFISSNKDSAQDKVWCVSGDAYPAKYWLTETCSTHLLSGPSVTIGLIKSDKDNIYDEKFNGPLAVCQHYIRPQKVAILTQQGTEIYEKLRPVDALAEILREKNGPDNEVIRDYFMAQDPEQACATALILACNQSSGMAQLAEWATRAFFLYGGDPKHLIQQQPQQLNMLQYSLPPGFKPNTVSTPLGSKPMGSMQESFSVQTSYKHNGLYLHLSRILRPIWGREVISKLKMSDGKVYMISQVTVEQIAVISSHLLSLKAFLEKNAQSPLKSIPNQFQVKDSVSGVGVTSPTNHRARVAYVEAASQEKRSLDSLRAFVDHATQVLGLWRILCDHQFHIVADTLPLEQQTQLSAVTFRDLILGGQDLCSSLINKLINIYLNDNSSVDAVSSKLREVCPSLYRSEDAACSKANEILQAAKDKVDQEEKFGMLRKAIKLCKEVSPHVNLQWVCKQLTICKYYEGVLELCQNAANKLDPNNFALHYYCNNQPPEDTIGYKAYVSRLTAYKEVQLMLDSIYQQCQFSGCMPHLSPGSQPNTNQQKILQDVLNKCLEVNDEVLHALVYDWLISRNLHASLVSFGRPSLERYLSKFPMEPNLRDLLWQYHERSGNHAAAAQLLFNLANTVGENIKLHQRLTYLGKAVTCMRSDGAGCAPHLGLFLHELEDMVQVARVQKQVLDMITNLPGRDLRTEDAIKKLNSGLLSITELYEEFAEPFVLWECKLIILDCAGHDDRELINMIWDNIIAEEIGKSSSSGSDDQMTIVMSKVKSLGLQFTVQSPCFPVAYLVWQLEILSCKLGTNKSHVHSTFLSIGVSISALLEIYEKLFAVNERCWLLEGNEFHLVQVIASLADSFIVNPRISPSSERKGVAVRMHDLITNCLSTLYSKPDMKHLVSYLKTVQTNLNHI